MDDIKEAIYEEKFVNSTFCKSGHQKQNEYRKQALFTDVILRGVDGSEFPVHKIVIAAQCPYFEALFHSELKECSQNVIQLDRNISRDQLEQIIEYLYIGEICINSENAKIFNEIAVFLELRCLKSAAAKVLEKILTIDKSLELWRFAVKHFNDDLSSYCLRFICQNIKQCFKKFLRNLTADEFEQILTCDSLLCSQEFLFINIIDWLKNNTENRETDFEKLARKINFSEISEDCKSTVLKDEILMNTFFIIKVLFQETFTKKTDIEAESNLCACPNPDNNNIYALTNSWITKIDSGVYPRLVPIIKFNKGIGYSVCEYNSNSILISGGESNNSCISYTINTDKIEDFPSMKEERQNHSVISLNNKIYACGGYKKNGSMEVMDLGKLSWSIGKPLKIGKQYDFGIESWGGTIYVFGGVASFPCINKNSTIGETIYDSKSVQRFDPRENIWYEVNMESPGMQKPKCLRVDDTIYCFTDLRTPQIFDIRTNKWTSSELWSNDWCYPPSNCDVIKLNECLYLLGIYDIKFSYKYNLATKTRSDWILDKSSFHGGRINLIKLSQ